MSIALLSGSALIGIKMSISDTLNDTTKTAYIIGLTQASTEQYSQSVTEEYPETRHLSYSEPTRYIDIPKAEYLKAEFAETSPLPEPEQTEEPAREYYDVPLSEEMQDYIFELEEKYNVPSAVIIAVIDKESRYNPGAVGGLGEQGYMQINPCNNEWLSKELGVSDFFDPEQNIECGTYILSMMLEKYGTVNKALMCYNCGEGGASNLWKKGVTETDYCRAIAEIMDGLTMKEA